MASHAAKSLNPLEKEGLVIPGTAICIGDSNIGINSDFVNIESASEEISLRSTVLRHSLMP